MTDTTPVPTSSLSPQVPPMSDDVIVTVSRELMR